MNNKRKNNRIFGWFLLILLIIAALGVSYVKFFMSGNADIEERSIENSSAEAIEKVLMEIVDNFNNHEKIKEYEDNNIKIQATQKNNNIFILYQDSELITYEFTYNNLFLMTTISNSDNNVNVFKNVYEILIYAVQERLKNENNIATCISSFLDGKREYDGLIRKVDGNNIIYKMDITYKFGVCDSSNGS